MISLIQTAEGALNETHSILQRMRELTVQAGNTGTQEPEDLKALEDELASLKEELGGVAGGSPGIADRTEFNGKTLLNGDLASDGLTFQIGANSGQQLTLKIQDMSASALGVNDIAFVSGTGESMTANVTFNASIDLIDKAINKVSTERSNLGAVQNRLDHTINNLGTSAENLTAAESRIRDVDMAKEMMEFTKNNILSQAAQSMLAQANQQPQGVLQLLQ